MSDEPDFSAFMATRLYDYIDIDGDLLGIDLSEEFLVISIMRAGQRALLGVAIKEPSEARKIAGTLLSWADEKEGIA